MKKNKQFLIFGIMAIVFTIILINFAIPDKMKIKETDFQPQNPTAIGVPSTYQIDSFEISTIIINGSINSITKRDDTNSILVEIDPIDQGNLTIKIPKTMLKPLNDDYSKFLFFVLSDGEEITYEQLDSETIKINFKNNTQKIEIIGASRLN